MQLKNTFLKPIALFALLFLSLDGSTQTDLLPSHRTTDWSIAGLISQDTDTYSRVDMTAYDIHPGGDVANDDAIQAALADIPSHGAYLIFPEGEFLFNESIRIQSSNVIIKGQGAEKTTFRMDLGGDGNSIHIEGELDNEISPLTQTATKDSHTIKIANASLFQVGDWIRLTMDDSEYIFSDWALNTVGQIARIESITGNLVTLRSPLRIDIKESNNAFIQKIDVLENVGIECIKIFRVDNTAPIKTCNVFMRYTVNSWVTGIESENCTFSHFDARFCSNLLVNKSYFHRAHGYGTGGRAYGVTLQYSSNECLIENNTFEHLRHAILLQAGANGNVITYNYTTDQTWTSWPAAGGADIAIHGNYPFLNLMEQNICENIVLDFSHGENGPYNTFFRNRAEGFGLRFSAGNSPSQNIIGTEVTNQFLTIRGDDHLLYGNNETGTILPAGTEVLEEKSLYYSTKPDFVSTEQWAAIGPGNNINSASIPARDRFLLGAIFEGACVSASSTDAFVEIDSPPSHCIGDTVIINSHTNLSAAIYEWKEDNEVISTQATLTLVPTEVATRSIELTIRQHDNILKDTVLLVINECGLGIRVTKASSQLKEEQRQVKSLADNPIAEVQVSLWSADTLDRSIDTKIGAPIYTDEDGIAVFRVTEASWYYISIDPINFESGSLASSAPQGDFSFDPVIGLYIGPIEYFPNGEVSIEDQTFIPSTLPLEFISFDANYSEENKAVGLRWQTANEVNTSHFVIQKSINDNEFEDIAVVEANPDNDGNGTYSLVDTEINYTGDLLYRIEQVDQDGSSSYSDIKVVRVVESAKVDVKIYPNPSSDYIIISAEKEVSSLTEIQLVDIHGKEVQVNKQEENSEIRLDVQSLPEGTYVLLAGSNQDKQAFPIMIQR